MKQILILGAGGHGSVCAEICKALDLPVLGFIDDNAALSGKAILGYPVLGNLESISKYAPAGHLLVNGIGSIGAATLRDELFMKYRSLGYPFQTLVHPSAIVSPSAVIEEGAQIHLGAHVQTRSKIGMNAIVNTGAIIDHDCVIGQSAHIAPGAVISGGGRVGNLALIGTGARLIQKMRVGECAVVGAGAVVTKDVADGKTAVGVPAKTLA